MPSHRLARPHEAGYPVRMSATGPLAGASLARRTTLATGLAGLLVAGPALAAPGEPDPAVLRWRATDGRCPAEARLRARIDALAGAAPGLSADAEVHAPAHDDPRWRLDLQIRWARGHDDRTLHASSCDALADATVVLVAVLAAPLALADRFVPPVTATPPAATPVVPAAPVPAAPAPMILAPIEDLDAAGPPERPARAPRAPTRFVRRRGPFARVAAIAGFGVLPRFDLGIQLAAGALLPRVRIEGALLLLPPQTEVLRDGSDRGAVPAFASAAVRVCPRFLERPIDLSLCGAIEGGVSWSRSVGVDPERRARGPWLAFALGPALDWWFSPQVALHLAVEAVGAPVTTTYSLGPAVVAGGRPFGVRGGFGLTFALAQQKPGRPEK